ncbi:hypothetical protein [Chryseobacterium arthrosphaerae]|uniref:hypothetical protein n=1 Tax=Chryseobacterium arthrosphaerae TaxID=651561 RepID=UPI001F4B9BC8|nr:hypothetical protein [Chryseobacterium arthrosphaerae]
MKTKILLLLLLGWIGLIYGQDSNESGGRDIVKSYNYHIKDVYSKYGDNQVVQPKTLAKNLNTIYQSIIPNSQSFNDNTTSFSYVQTDDNQKVAISTAYQFSDISKTFLNVGISVEGKSGIFNIYSSKSWSNNTALTIGISRGFWESQFYTKEYIKKIKLDEKRKLFADSLRAIIQYNALLDQVQMHDSLNFYQKRLDDINIVLSNSHNSEIKQETLIALYVKKIKYFESKINNFKYLDGIYKKEKIREDVINKFADFDAKSESFHGYNVVWWQVGTKLLNNTYTFKALNNSEKVTNINVFHANINASLMWNTLTAKTANYLTGGVSAFRGSFLSDPSLRGISPLISDTDIVNDGIVIGNITNLKKPLWQYSFNVYGASFFLFKKHLGLSGSFIYNNAIKKNFASYYKENYTTLFGPIFKMQGEDSWAKATFGISIGYENLPPKAKAKDYFAIKAYIGVPFNVFQKKDKK